MTFAYVGYIWSLLGCGFVALFAFGIGASLYFAGKRLERRRPRTVAIHVTSSSERVNESSSPETSSPETSSESERV